MKRPEQLRRNSELAPLDVFGEPSNMDIAYMNKHQGGTQKSGALAGARRGSQVVGARKMQAVIP